MNLSEIDINALTFQQLRIRYMSGRDSVRGEGRYKTHQYHHYAVTEIGEIELSEWYRMARSLIERDREEDLLASLAEWEMEHDYTGMTPAQVEESAVELHISRIFDEPLWVYFVPFNRKYRPDILKMAHLVWVLTPCCNRPEQTTQEQIDCGRYDGEEKQIFCPVCGRISSFRIVDAPMRNTE